MRRRARRHAWSYLALALSWTWAFWWTAAALGQPWGEPATMLLFVLGGAGVPAVAIAMLHLFEDRAAWRSYWLSVVDVQRLTWQGAAVIFLLPPVLGLLGVAVHVLETGEWALFVPVRVYMIDPGAFFLFLAITFLFGPLPEELGWRGYALPYLQRAYPVLAATLILGAVHALWHLPLFYMPGSYQHALGVATADFWRFMASIVALAVILTWLYNHTGGSILGAILLHFMINASGQLMRMPQSAEFYRAGFLILFALALLVVTRGRLGYAPG